MCVSFWASAQDNSENTNFWLNAFDQARSEQLVQDGLQQMRSGQFERAERTFLDAMQIAKVNFGLNSPEQRIPLEYAIDAQLAQGKWDQVETNVSYFEWLNDEVYSKDFYEYLNGTEQLSSLLLRASANTENPIAVRYLIAAKNLNWRAVSSIEATLGDAHPQLAPWLYNIVLAHYYQSSLLKRRGVSRHAFRNDADEEISGWTMNVGDSLRISYRIGRELLARIEAIYMLAEEDVPPESRAIATLYRADWEKLFGNDDEALAIYEIAYKRFLQAGLSEAQTNQLFARPTVLPANELHNSFASMLTEQQEGPVRFNAWTPNYPTAALPSERAAINGGMGTEIMALVRFDLHPLLPTGLINNNRTIRLGFNLADLEVLETTPDNALIAERARREVSLLQFRPKLENGTPVPLEGVELEYRFPPQFSVISISGN